MEKEIKALLRQIIASSWWNRPKYISDKSKYENKIINKYYPIIKKLIKKYEK